jgi:aldehyde dehydrogenase (NAD+)
MVTSYSYGGGCINDTLVQFTNKRLPFGGVGHSGMGAYHGAQSFLLFSHKKSVVKRGTWLDVPTRYAPYHGKINLIKKMLSWFS